MRMREELRLTGRMGRLGFWARHLLVLPLALAVCIGVRDQLGAPWDLLPVMVTLAFLVSVWARRLHDRGRSAWWLAMALVPLLGALLLIVECGIRGTVGSEAAGADYKTV